MSDDKPTPEERAQHWERRHEEVSDSFYSALFIEPCHLGGGHDVRHREEYVCEWQLRGLCIRLLHAMGYLSKPTYSSETQSELAKLPRKLHEECCQCFDTDGEPWEDIVAWAAQRPHYGAPRQVPGGMGPHREESLRLRKALEKIILEGDYTAPEGMKRIARAALVEGDPK